MARSCGMKRAGCTPLRISTPYYICRDAGASLVRNGWMTLASMAVVAVSLIILGSSVLLVLNADYLAERLESEVEISVFLQEDLTAKETNEVGRKIRNTPGIAEIEYVPSDKALEEMKESFGDRGDVLDNLPKNPLPDAYRIKAEDANQVPVMAQSFEKFQGVEMVRYGQGLVEKLLAITHWVRAASLGLMVILGLSALFLIATTIRMSVFARRREIGIMKLLGATNWYVRMPFLIEGVVIGFVGAALAVTAVNLGYVTLLKQLHASVPFITLVSSGEVLFTLLAVLMGLGIIIGALGSLVSIHRFLKV